VLRGAGYEDDAVAARVGVESVYAFRSVREGRSDPGGPRDALDALIRLFMDGEPLARSMVHALVPGLAAAAERLGLLHSHPSDAAALVPTVRLYPLHGLTIVSDLEHDPASPVDVPFALPPDVVYAAITDSTRMFLALLPERRCARFLDLCAGTGIAGLLAAAYADEVVASDIAERSVAFARFNVALNGLTNVRAVCADVYDGLEGETFDRIVAHPPYMPAHDQAVIYRDGGDDGEQVTRRVLEGLPAHLRPGGRFDCIAILTDREDAPVEARVRALLGDRSDEFDVLVLVTQSNKPVDAYARLVREGRVTFAEAERHVQRFSALQAERIVGCSLVLVRHEAPRPAVTVRRTRSPSTDAAAIEWVLGWMRASGDPRLSEKLLEARPRVSPRARMDRDYGVGDDGWQAGECRIRVDAPFGMVVPVSLELAAILARCDGEATVREQLALLQRAGVLAGDLDPVAFADSVRSLIVGGFLLLDPPAATA
jgi:SAM-dependent methyltransferase